MIVSYEDRPSHFIGMKLLALSLKDSCGDPGLEVTVPGADARLKQWFEANHISLKSDGPVGRSGYDVKPTLLRRALATGADEAIWLDGDIIVTADPRGLWKNATPETIVVAEEFLGAPAQGGTLRTRDWGLPVGRALPNTTNSCIVRVTSAHLDLLHAWEKLLEADEYRAAQAKPWYERPRHLAGDQDALCALLGSKQFASIPIRWVRRGTEVAHCFGPHGYVLHQRVWNLVAGVTPVLIHGQGAKPWDFSGRKKPLYLELSPYALAAERYQDRVAEDMSWVVPHGSLAKNLRRMFKDHLTAAGLVPALAHEIRDQRLAKTIIAAVMRRSAP